MPSRRGFLLGAAGAAIAAPLPALAIDDYAAQKARMMASIPHKVPKREYRGDGVRIWNRVNDSVLNHRPFDLRVQMSDLEQTLDGSPHLVVRRALGVQWWFGQYMYDGEPPASFWNGIDAELDERAAEAAEGIRNWRKIARMSDSELVPYLPISLSVIIDPHTFNVGHEFYTMYAYRKRA